MKIIYEFEPYDDKHDLETFQSARKNAAKLDNVRFYLSRLKFEESENISIEKVRSDIYDIIGDYEED